MRHLDPESLGWGPASDFLCDEPPAISPDQRSDEADESDDHPIIEQNELDPVFRDDIDQILMTQSAYLEALDYFAAREPEAALLLLGPKNEDIVTHILADDDGRATPVSFMLAATKLNRKVKPYLAAGLDIKGIQHLHPSGVTCLSHGDLVYVRTVFQNPKHQSLERFMMPITAGGRFYGFVVTRAGKELCVRHARPVLVQKRLAGGPVPPALFLILSLPRNSSWTWSESHPS